MRLTEGILADIDAFDPGRRRDALARWLSAGEFALPAPGGNVNMHFHSFFSYNAEGWSPTRIALEARAAGLYAAGLCDFDVLDGLEEFLDAGLRLGLRTAANIETRAFLSEYADVEISSPGEPGVTYIMGAGFARTPAAGTPEAAGLDRLREGARARNLALIARVNPRIGPIAIDYTADVLPLTPGGAATERHIVSAYVNRAMDTFPEERAAADFFAGLLGADAGKARAMLRDRVALEGAVRNRLAKRGGLGYEQPSPGAFPPVPEFIAWVRACRAIPMVAWLDGTSRGEEDGRALLECLRAHGAAALNIIPDRNWNIAEPSERARKTANLDAIVAAATDLGLPINIGTEMNRPGLPFVDDLDGPALRAHKAAFLAGARVMVGQTLLARYADLSYVDERADDTCGGSARKRAFFEAVGGLPPLDPAGAERLRGMGPAKALEWLRGRARC